MVVWVVCVVVEDSKTVRQMWLITCKCPSLNGPLGLYICVVP
jgi:hypothetical protein